MKKIRFNKLFDRDKSGDCEPPTGPSMTDQLGYVPLIDYLRHLTSQDVSNLQRAQSNMKHDENIKDEDLDGEDEDLMDLQDIMIEKQLRSMEAHAKMEQMNNSKENTSSARVEGSAEPTPENTGEKE